MTDYKEIFDNFKDKITDYDLPLYTDDIQYEILCSILRKACAKFGRICKSDLSTRDDEVMSFGCDLKIEEIDILTEWMVYEWLTPYLNNIENLRNQLNTKDFSFFSPANLLEKISNTYELARKHAKSLTNEYSFAYADMSELKT